jgi:hypothetical protein
MTEPTRPDNAAKAKPWPGGKRIAVVFNVCLEAWSDGKAPGISPMGHPLPAGMLDTTAISWAGYRVKRGTYRLLDARHRAAASVMVSAVIAGHAAPRMRQRRACSPKPATSGTATCSTTTFPMSGAFGGNAIIAIALGTDVKLARQAA